MFMEDYVNLCFVKKHCLRNSNNVRERIFHGNTNIFFFFVIGSKSFCQCFYKKIDIFWNWNEEFLSDIYLSFFKGIPSRIRTFAEEGYAFNNVGRRMKLIQFILWIELEISIPFISSLTNVVNVPTFK